MRRAMTVIGHLRVSVGLDCILSMDYIASMTKMSISHGQKSVGRPKEFDARLPDMRMDSAQVAKIDQWARVARMDRSSAIRWLLSWALADEDAWREADEMTKD